MINLRLSRDDAEMEIICCGLDCADLEEKAPAEFHLRLSLLSKTPRRDVIALDHAVLFESEVGYFSNSLLAQEAIHYALNRQEGSWFAAIVSPWLMDISQVASEQACREDGGFHLFADVRFFCSAELLDAIEDASVLGDLNSR